MQTYQINHPKVKKLEWSGEWEQNWEPENEENSVGYMYRPGTATNKPAETGDLTIYFTDEDRQPQTISSIPANTWLAICRKEKASEILRMIPGFTF